MISKPEDNFLTNFYEFCGFLGKKKICYKIHSGNQEHEETKKK